MRKAFYDAAVIGIILVSLATCFNLKEASALRKRNIAVDSPPYAPCDYMEPAMTEGTYNATSGVKWCAPSSPLPPDTLLVCTAQSEGGVWTVTHVDVQPGQKFNDVPPTGSIPTGTVLRLSCVRTDGGVTAPPLRVRAVWP